MASTVAFTAFDVLMSIQEYGIVPRNSHANRIAGNNDPYNEGAVWCNYFDRNIPYDTRPLGEDVQKLASIASTITSYQLHSLVYHSSGIYQTSMQRYPFKKFETDIALIFEVTKRVQNTVCLILDNNAITLDNDAMKDGYFTYFSEVCFAKEGHYKGFGTHKEYRLKGRVSPEHIQAVLVPLHLTSIARAFFGSKMIPVMDYNTSPFSILHLRDVAPILTRPGSGINPKISCIAPDYLAGLNKAVELNPDLIHRGFFTHVVRLPYEEDLIKGPNEESFFIKINSEDAEEVFQKIRIDERYRIRKCFNRENLNEFEVICKPDAAKDLNEMLQRMTINP